MATRREAAIPLGDLEGVIQAETAIPDENGHVVFSLARSTDLDPTIWSEKTEIAVTLWCSVDSGPWLLLSTCRAFGGADIREKDGSKPAETTLTSWLPKARNRRIRADVVVVSGRVRTKADFEFRDGEFTLPVVTRTR